MRMWMIDPKYLCRKHLLGEHGEIHKHKWCFERKHNMSGRFKPFVQIEPKSMQVRHDDLAREMLKRGYKHQSPYKQPDISHMPNDQRFAEVDVGQSMRDLVNRCPECKERLHNA